MKAITQSVLLVALLALVARAADVVPKASNPPPVRIVFLGYTNDAAQGRLARLCITNSQKHDVLYGQALEEKTQAGWPVYPSGGRLPHSAFESLEAQASATFTVAVPTNGRTWRVSAIYQNLQTRQGQDFGGLRTAIADRLRPKEKYQGHWVWSAEMSE